MTTTAVPSLFAGLIDDASTFPPGDLPLPDAVRAHRDHRQAWYGSLVGPLLCRASALPELDLLARDDGPVAVSIVVDTGTTGVLEAVDAVAGSDRLVLRGVEVPVRGEPQVDGVRRTVAALDAALGGPDDDEPAHVELRREPGWERALDVVADSGYRAKWRTGGADPSAVPSSPELAAIIVACLERGVAFKLTAGLHHAVRQASGGEHGFLGVMAAVALALQHADPRDVAARLDTAEPEALRSAVDDLTEQQARSVRRWFTSFGSCSVAEPLADLVGLGLVTPPDPAGRS